LFNICDHLVVGKVNFQWTLRNGDEATCISNRRLNNLETSRNGIFMHERRWRTL